MKNKSIALALAGILSVTCTVRAQFASTVVSYTSGSGGVSGYTEPTSALGAPSTVTMDPTWGNSPVDPFDAPYLSSQIVGLGTGGSLTLQFNSPIQNDPNHLYGLDFIIFGHAGFNIVNGDYSGGGITDGSFYQGGDNGVTVSVSADGSTFYRLVSPYGTTVDGLYPTDGSGNPFLPVNPSLTAADFSGLTMSQINALYGGSAGGAGFSLNWAVDDNNQPVSLASVGFVRLQNSGNAAYIDALAIVPEPTARALALAGAGWLWLNRRGKMTGAAGKIVP